MNERVGKKKSSGRCKKKKKRCLLRRIPLDRLIYSLNLSLGTKTTAPNPGRGRHTMTDRGGYNVVLARTLYDHRRRIHSLLQKLSGIWGVGIRLKQE